MKRSVIARAVGRRLLLAVPTLVGVVFLIFVAIDLAPGDPATAALGTFATAEQRVQFREEQGLDDPLPVRFVRFAGDLATGDLGQSTVRPEPVVDLLGQALPVTLQLTGLALLLAVLGALVAGTLSAMQRDRWPDRVARLLTSAGLAAPDFWIGILAIQIIAVGLGWLPSGGYVPFTESPVDWLRSLVLPATVLAIPVASALAVLLRGALVDELEKDYVRTAQGLGLSRRAVLVRHVLRNALMGPLTVLGLRAGYLLGGAIIVEFLFILPGLGTLLINSVNEGDLGVARGVAIVTTLLFVLVNIAVDTAYLVLNPRISRI